MFQLVRVLGSFPVHIGRRRSEYRLAVCAVARMQECCCKYFVALVCTRRRTRLTKPARTNHMRTV